MLNRLSKMNHTRMDAAGKLLFFACRTNGVMRTRMAMIERNGRATACGYIVGDLDLYVDIGVV